MSVLKSVLGRLEVSATKFKIGDLVRVNAYDEKGKLPASKPLGTITELPKKKGEGYKVKLKSAGTTKMYYLNEITVA